MPAPVPITPLAARRFLLQAQGLEHPFETTQAALEHLGYVQIDPLNICGRMHDLILRNRVAHYQEGDLVRHLHGAESTAAESGLAPANRRRLDPTTRIAFEHHHPVTHILVAFPLEAWPHLRGAMRARAKETSAWSGRLTPTERALAPQLLAEIKTRGPMGSEDFNDGRRAHRSIWGQSSLVKSTLQKLFFHGELLIAERENNRRRYDLPEHVLPPSVLAQPEAPAAETTRWLARLKLRQWRLCTLKRDELPAIADEVRPVAIEGCPVVYCLQDDLPLLEAAESEVTRTAKRSAEPKRRPTGTAGSTAPQEPTTVKLLAPLDPLIYDRRLTRALWNFDYTWEAYTPPAKRVRGHYALPVLAGTELVGHVEPKVDRAAGKLVVASRSVRRAIATSLAVRELATWLGVR